ncbi:MAG: hypothetical protein QGI45_12030 [Myxococcota bacterium]|nr:hypothetical protein [Myxococcota bacterium]
MHIKTHLIRSLLICSPFLTSCMAEEIGTALEITNITAPDTATCEAGTAPISIGTYDPVGILDRSTPDGYIVGLNIKNGLRETDADQVSTSHGWGNVRAGANNLQIVGFDVCFYRADDISIASFGSHTDGKPIDCAILPTDQREFIPTSLSIAPTEIGLTKIKVLSPTHLQAVEIFGPQFKAEDIPLQGETITDTNFDTDTSDPTDKVYSFGPESFSPDTRNEAWGNFPASQKTTLIIQMRANGKRQTGEVVQSNWYSAPVELCIGCAASLCGDLQSVVCSGDYCSDGSGCPQSGTCASNGATCTPMVTAFAGAIASGATICAPAQQQISLTCEEVSFCP